jgi:hypothetical protein
MKHPRLTLVVHKVLKLSHASHISPAGRYRVQGGHWNFCDCSALTGAICNDINQCNAICWYCLPHPKDRRHLSAHWVSVRPECNQRASAVIQVPDQLGSWPADPCWIL